MSLLDEVIGLLASGVDLPAKYGDHALTGDYTGFRDLHIKPDWLLLYYIEEDVVVFYDTGSHSDLF